MLKVRKDQLINEDKIESICLYGSEPLVRIVQIARANNVIHSFIGNHGYKSLIAMDDGFLFLCPNYPEIYFSRLDLTDYLIVDAKKYAIRKSCIREISSNPSKSQHQDIIKAKNEKRFYNLSGHKKTKYYIFTVSGRIYGVPYIRKLSQETDPANPQNNASLSTT